MRGQARSKKDPGTVPVEVLPPMHIAEAATPLMLSGYRLALERELHNEPARVADIFLAEAAVLRTNYLEESWSRPNRPTRINLSKWLVAADYCSTSCPFPRIGYEIQQALRHTQMKVVHGDLLEYEASRSDDESDSEFDANLQQMRGQVLGWHQDSFDLRRHLCTVVLDLVNESVCDDCRRLEVLSTSSRLDNPGSVAGMKWVECEDCVSATSPAEDYVHRCCFPCLQEWVPIVRDRPGDSDAESQSRGSPYLEHNRSFALPTSCRLSVHGVTCNNENAHRYVFRPKKETRKHTLNKQVKPMKRLAVVLFCVSDALRDICRNTEIKLDMSRWWKPEMNE